MRSAAIVGLGQASAAGAGADALAAALEGAWPEPARDRCAGAAPAGGLPVLLARLEALETLAEPRLLRRLDRLARGALLSTLLAVESGGLGRPSGQRVGLVLATGRGALATSFAFLDDVIEKGDRRGSPILFASSVHGAPASAVASFLGVLGPTLTVTGGATCFAEALALGLDLLEEPGLDLLLLVAADEHHEALGYRLARDGLHARGGRAEPFADGATVPGEAFVTLALARSDEPPPWGWIEEPALVDPAAASPELGPGPLLLGAVGRPGEASAWAALARSAQKVCCPAPLWGAVPTGHAMLVATAALALRRRRLPALPFSGPVPDGVTVAGDETLAPGGTLACAALEATGRGAMVTLRGTGGGHGVSSAP